MKVFLFPGQGSQQVGIAADLFKSDSSFRRLVALASELVGEDLETICLRGPEKKLVRTKHLQPLLVAVSLGYLRHLTERGIQPDLVLGHSLGEITALAAVGVVTPEEAVRIAAKRGEFMEEAAAKVNGGMLAVTLEDRTPLLNWLDSTQAKGRAVLANDNAPNQIVLSGEASSLTACAEFISGARLGRSRWLSVSGPWHSRFMTEAAARFADWLHQVPFESPRTPMLFNLSGAHAITTEEIRYCISGVLDNPVLWRSCMDRLKETRPTALFEIGPGRVLSGLARLNQVPNETRIFSVNNLRGVELAPRTA